MAELKDLRLTPAASLSPEFLSLCKSVNAKRARTVIDHILKHGVITNEDLSEQYGYDHPPRAIRDVRENGIPLVTHKIKSPKTGRKIGAYTFDDLANVKRGRIGGRKAFSKQFKQLLIDTYGARDAFTNEALDERYLQIDHRIPYEISGDGEELASRDFMLIDASSQRTKSWSCEHCRNFLELHDASICKKCFWASPEAYDHVAMEQKRRLDIVWAGKEVSEYESARKLSAKLGVSLSAYVKQLLRK
ncbi:MAG: HNH endonuclease [Proteobacteria bacterium]|nr:HNH endonuclease [Pseudomonadota bacterium]